jgi:hypothetical protein
MEVSEARRQLRGAIENAKRHAAERRTRVDEAARAYERFLTDVAVPAFHLMAQALTGEGYRFKVHTPGQAVRLAPDRASDDHIEIALDSERDVPAVVVRTVRGRGRRMVSSERAIGEDKKIDAITDRDVIAVLLEELISFIER